ncbi:hypothetical protein EVAR_93014_1 [Eumeta japonica]|uniref:DDE Tnp4 domain-containing protein n=1 Tax=Eumeta variegata TaxID=151549 RepID=A0A4C2ADG9_EUMVA|nr:hypothetical protein EVAR_93014_1 [Eumeta japonica]
MPPFILDLGRSCCQSHSRPTFNSGHVTAADFDPCPVLDSNPGPTVDFDPASDFNIVKGSRFCSSFHLRFRYRYYHGCGVQITALEEVAGLPGGCAVPQCNNTSIKHLISYLYSFHKENDTRQVAKTCKAGCNRDIAYCSPLFCEDHFDLPNDMENYMEYHVMGSVSQVRMKPACMPSKFQCQPDRRKRTFNATKRPYILKKRRLTLIKECEKDLEERSVTTKQVEVGESSSGISVKLDNELIKKLPMAFRHKYHNVTCIIDCLEIEVQKPSKALHQALMVRIQKANTIKYLVSCTPNGLINYISPGYGGRRITDTCLVEQCDFIRCLQPGMYVMADRGFKHVEQYLRKEGVQLVRPPSVTTGAKLSKSEVRETKQIASLRIHVERVIRRLQEFNMLKPHACVNHNLVKVLDDVITIACGLVNIQDSLIK